MERARGFYGYWLVPVLILLLMEYGHGELWERKKEVEYES